MRLKGFDSQPLPQFVANGFDIILRDEDGATIRNGHSKVRFFRGIEPGTVMVMLDGHAAGPTAFEKHVMRICARQNLFLYRAGIRTIKFSLSPQALGALQAWFDNLDYRLAPRVNQMLSPAFAGLLGGASLSLGGASLGCAACGPLAKSLAGIPAYGRVTQHHVAYAMKKLAPKVKRCGITPTKLRQGMQVELEHRDVTRGGIEKTARIAAAHLCESPRYYAELKKLERKLR